MVPVCVSYADGLAQPVAVSEMDSHPIQSSAHQDITALSTVYGDGEFVSAVALKVSQDHRCKPIAHERFFGSGESH